jgi:cytochrome c oxidase subunit 2
MLVQQHRRTCRLTGIVRPATALGLAVLATGCGPQSMLSPAGPRAEVIADIWWAMFWGAVAVQLLVLLLGAYALWWRGRRPAVRSSVFIVGGGVLLPLVSLTLLLVYGYRIGAFLAAPPADALRIEVVGQQFWWQARYPGQTAVETAGVLRIPVGEPVLLALRTKDVIHSFWVPRLAGKQDLIPGRVNDIWLQADRPGVYRGQCAEFCGAQHARMALVVVAEPRPQFDAWLEAQRRAAPDPGADPGFSAFMQSDCQSCHRIRGTDAGGERGPDLTHIGSRWRLRAEHAVAPARTLVDWIRLSHLSLPEDEQPSGPASLPAQQLESIAGYLEGLQ